MRKLTRAQARIAERERCVAAIEKFWNSLETHLPCSVRELSAEERGQFGGSRKFHADTVREYATAIVELAKNL